MATGCNSRSPSDANGGQTREELMASRSDFWSQMYMQLDYTHFETLEELWEITDVTVVGRIKSVSEGRTLGGTKGERGTLETALIRLEVDEVVTGELEKDSRKKIDIEILRSESSSIEELAESAPDEPLLLLLQNTAKQPKAHEIDESGVEREPGKTLYTIPTPKALFIERDDDVVTPLDPAEGPYEDSIEATTLPELADEIRFFEE